MHRAAGSEIASLRIDALWGIRGQAQEMVAGATGQGMKATKFFATSEAAATELISEVRSGDLVLIKGSRSVETDRVISALRSRFPLVGEDQEV
jgi:UDP-N-acetylmuramyl pentapeptide synthase